MFIRGIDLGVRAGEIEVRMGESTCEILSSQYITGKHHPKIDMQASHVMQLFM